MKLKKFLIITLSLLISVFLIVILLGQRATVDVYMVKKEGLDPNKTIGEQADFFVRDSIYKDDFEKLGGSMVTAAEWGKYQSKQLKLKLDKGSMIPKTALVDSNKSGQFANDLEKNHTLYKMPQNLALPKGTIAGDKVDISLLSNDNNDRKVGILLRDVPIFAMDETGTYLKVSQKHYNILKVAEGMGEFIVQLPGRKNVAQCTDQELLDRNKKGIECYVKDDANTNTTRNDVKQLIEENQRFDQQVKDEQENQMKIETSTDGKVDDGVQIDGKDKTDSKDSKDKKEEKKDK